MTGPLVIVRKRSLKHGLRVVIISSFNTIRMILLFNRPRDVLLATLSRDNNRGLVGEDNRPPLLQSPIPS
jgi:hypothetical protein